MNNVGKIDRLIRIIAAVAIVILHFTGNLPAEYSDIILVVAIVLAMTSLRKCCPLYALLGFGTCGVNTGSEEATIETKKLRDQD